MKYFYGLSLLILILLFLVGSSFPDTNLHVIACDVGQGDGILITMKSTQILIDGGPNNKILNCLSRHMPFWDKDIELVVLTHPDADHSTGLVDVFQNYTVDTFVGEQVDASTKIYQLLKKTVGGSTAKLIIPHTGLKLGTSPMSLDVLHPALGFQTPGTNNYSVTIALHYKNFSGLFTGDLEDKVVKLEDTGLLTQMTYLKVPHHGSKNGLTQELLDAVSPKIAVISAGKNNVYGHPHQEILTMLQQKGVQVERTDLKGDVEVISDGTTWWLK